ncbi:MAG: hypothetical protein K5900_05995 [Butyrivibrio sp.]|nr:hypothetical protein [Butyrivibrio sp.]
MIEITTVISFCSLLIAATVAVTNIRRNSKADDKNEATQLTTVIVKLENIGDDIRDIKKDIKEVNLEVQSIKERLLKVEQSTKSAHHRLDHLEGIKNEKETQII